MSLGRASENWTRKWIFCSDNTNPLFLSRDVSTYCAMHVGYSYVMCIKYNAYVLSPSQALSNAGLLRQSILPIQYLQILHSSIATALRSIWVGID